MTLKVMGDFYRDVDSTLSAAQLAIDSSSRDIRPCDPKKHQRGQFNCRKIINKYFDDTINL